MRELRLKEDSDLSDLVCEEARVGTQAGLLAEAFEHLDRAGPEGASLLQQLSQSLQRQAFTWGVGGLNLSILSHPNSYLVPLFIFYYGKVYVI